MGFEETLRRHLPKTMRHWLGSLRRVVRRTWRRLLRPLDGYRFAVAVRELRRIAPALPDRRLAERLIRSWHNPAAAEPDYLLAVVEHARAARLPVLECGSGLTTVVLAVYSPQPVLSLESDAGWHRRIVADLRRSRLDSSGVRLAPLADYDGFTWYGSLPDDLPAQFGLVVCDGPPVRGRPGGRVGLLPVLGDRLSPSATVLVDSDMRGAEATALAVWRDQFGVEEIEIRGTASVLRAPPGATETSSLG